MQIPLPDTTVDSLVLAPTLEAERRALAEGARLHWFHWLAVALSLLLTIAAWNFSTREVAEKTRIRFEREATRVVELISERMQKYEEALRAGVAAIHSAGGRMTHKQWRVFASSLQIETKYPGINGIGVIDSVALSDLESYVEVQRNVRSDFSVHPQHDGSESMPIVFIEPEAPNFRAVGLDMVHELNRYSAANRARRSGAPQITGPIFLVQEAKRRPGFLFFEAIFRDRIDDTEAERLENFVGLVYAPFVVEKLLEGTLDKERRRVNITLADGDFVLFDENVEGQADFDTNSLLTHSSEVDSYGRSWRFDIRSGLKFRADASSSQPTIVLIGGIAIDAMLLTLFLAQSRASRRTLGFADRVSTQLRGKSEALEQSNADLESFAYVAAHDLRTPLRGVTDLASYLEEDLEDYLDGPEANPDIRRNLGRIHQQAGRMNGLIKGILSYSRVAAAPEATEPARLAEIVSSLRSELGVRDEQLVLDSEVESIPTDATRFEQVLSNLIGNAFKYHHSRDQATVRVVGRRIDTRYEFRISDDGPGIAPEFHERIFEVFQSLQSKDEVESSGVGLAIVRRAVEALGGSVYVTSAPGQGSTFSFTWPGHPNGCVKARA